MAAEPERFAARGLTRRTVVKAGAWALPVIAVAVGTPRAAASVTEQGFIVLAQDSFSFGPTLRTTISGYLHLGPGGVYPDAYDMALAFDGPTSIAQSGPFSIDSATGFFFCTLSVGPARPAGQDQVTITVSAPGFGSDTALVEVPTSASDDVSLTTGCASDLFSAPMIIIASSSTKPLPAGTSFDISSTSSSTLAYVRSSDDRVVAVRQGDFRYVTEDPLASGDHYRVLFSFYESPASATVSVTLPHGWVGAGSSQTATVASDSCNTR